jgi:hypothetical protein
VWLEGEHTELGVWPGRVGGVQQVDMAAMYAIKIAECEHHPTGISRKVAPVGVQHVGLSCVVGQVWEHDLHRSKEWRK